MADRRLELVDPLAHRALEALRWADSALTRSLEAQLEREGVSATGFEMLVLLHGSGGRLELRALRRWLRTSKANASEVLDTLVGRGLVTRQRSPRDRRAIVVELTEAGGRLVGETFPQHADRVRSAFDVLGDEEKRQLTDICRKLARAA